eukprot:COSAG02_NODE_1019_length_15171_cov_7.663482_3_plen_116_part_00
MNLFKSLSSILQCSHSSNHSSLETGGGQRCGGSLVTPGIRAGRPLCLVSALMPGVRDGARSSTSEHATNMQGCMILPLTQPLTACLTACLTVVVGTDEGHGWTMARWRRAVPHFR